MTNLKLSFENLTLIGEWFRFSKLDISSIDNILKRLE